MIKLEYTPRPCPFGDLPNLLELKMTLDDNVTWDEATKEFHNFLRTAGYKPPETGMPTHPVQKNWQEAHKLKGEKKNKEWVGLTDERYEDICGTFYEYGNKNFFHERGFDPVGYGKAIEAELKEKNT